MFPMAGLLTSLQGNLINFMHNFFIYIYIKQIYTWLLCTALKDEKSEFLLDTFLLPIDAWNILNNR